MYVCIWLNYGHSSRLHRRRNRSRSVSRSRKSHHRYGSRSRSSPTVWPRDSNKEKSRSRSITRRNSSIDRRAEAKQGTSGSIEDFVPLHIEGNDPDISSGESVSMDYQDDPIPQYDVDISFADVLALHDESWFISVKAGRHFVILCCRQCIAA